MVPTWSLLIVLLVGAAAGWFLRGLLAGRPAPTRISPVVEAATAPNVEPEAKMEAVLTELERRYQGRKAEPEPPARPKPPRRPRMPKG